MTGEIQYLVRGLLLGLLCLVFFQAGKILFNLPPESNETIAEPMPSCGGTTYPPSFSDQAIKGKSLFQQNCASCHALDKNLTGPALRGVEDRWPSNKLLITWIRNWPKAVRSGDPYPIEMAKSNPAVMTVFEDNLSVEEVELILTYLREVSAQKPQVVAYTNIP